MRRIFIAVTIMALLLAGIISYNSDLYAQSTKKVLMIPREGYSQDLDLALKMEVGVMLLHLKNAGLAVDIATPSGPLSGLAIVRPGSEKGEKTLRLADISVNNYVGVIMPCMGVGAYPGPAISQETLVIIKKALESGKPVAASTWSTTILAEGGLLKGKKYAASRDPLKTDENFKLIDSRYEGGIYSGFGVVQDGKIITSGSCPVIEKQFGIPSKVVELTLTFINDIAPK